MRGGKAQNVYARRSFAESLKGRRLSLSLWGVCFLLFTLCPCGCAIRCGWIFDRRGSDAVERSMVVIPWLYVRCFAVGLWSIYCPLHGGEVCVQRVIAIRTHFFFEVFRRYATGFLLKQNRRLEKPPLGIFRAKRHAAKTKSRSSTFVLFVPLCVQSLNHLDQPRLPRIDHCVQAIFDAEDGFFEDITAIVFGDGQ